MLFRSCVACGEVIVDTQEVPIRLRVWTSVGTLVGARERNLKSQRRDLHRDAGLGGGGRRRFACHTKAHRGRGDAYDRELAVVGQLIAALHQHNLIDHESVPGANGRGGRIVRARECRHFLIYGKNKIRDSILFFKKIIS